MVEIVTPALPVYKDRKLSEFAAPGQSVIGAMAGEAFHDLPIVQAARSITLDEASNGRRISRWGGRHEADSPIIDRGAADAQIKDSGLEGQLEVPQDGVRQRSLDLLIENKKEVNRRNAIISRSPGGFVLGAAGVATQLGVSLLDPTNIAMAFVPVVGEARYANLLARAGSTLGRTGVRAGVGAAEGVVGQAILEPMTYATDKRYQEAYGLNDALANIAFGGLFGAAVHNIAPAVRGAMKLAKGRDTTVTRAALSEAVASHLEGRTPRVSEMLQAVDKPPRVPVQNLTRAADIEAFTAAAVGRRNAELIDTGSVDPVTVGNVAETGLDISGMKHVMQTHDIRHTLRRHGEGADLRADEIPVTPADIARVPDILADPATTVRREADTHQGLPTLVFTKREGNTIVIVEEVKAAKQRMAFKSMRIKKSGRDGSPGAIDAPNGPQSLRPQSAELGREPGTAGDQDISSQPEDGKFDWADSGVENGDSQESAQSLTDVLTQIRDDRIAVPADESAALSQIQELAKGFDSGSPLEAQLAEIENFAAATEDLINLERQAGRITPEMDTALKDAATAVSDADKRGNGFRQAAFCIGRARA